MVINRVQPKAASHQQQPLAHSPNLSAAEGRKAAGSAPGCCGLSTPDRLPSLRPFIPVHYPAASRLVRPFLTRRSISCSIIGGGGRGAPLRHLPRLSAPDKTIRQSVNQSIRFFQKPVSRSPLEIHPPFRAAGQETSPFPDCQTVTQLCKRGQNIHKINR